MTLNAAKRSGFLFCRILLGLLALLLIVGTLLPLFQHEAWWIRIFDFPRLQIAVLIGLTLTAYLALHFWRQLRLPEYGLAAVVGLALIWQLISIAPYTLFYPKEISDSQNDDNTNQISILIFNVLSKNRQVDALRDLIQETDPDLILLSEPTDWWLEQLDGLQDDYPFTLFQPQDNHYGKLLYSRLELINPEVRFLIEPEVPSLRMHVMLRSGTQIKLYGLHPRPPGLKRPVDENTGNANEAADDGSGEREDSDMRDAELLVIAKEVKQLGNAPVIVAGDLNDVAWSHTTHLFQRIGGLLDPRVGRGLINTFDTRSRLMRYPLDHVFASQHFRLVELRRLADIGSDHFPMLVTLEYDPSAMDENKEPQSDLGDKQEAEEAIEKGKTNN